MFAIYSTCKLWYVPYCDRANCDRVMQRGGSFGPRGCGDKQRGGSFGPRGCGDKQRGGSFGPRGCRGSGMPRLERRLRSIDYCNRGLHVKETNHICTVLFNCYGYLLFSSFVITYLCVYNIELTLSVFVIRSEERRVGKECRSRWS